MGELMVLYGVVDVAFIGDSLVANGGHNKLEAAAWGMSILLDSSMFNFAEIAERLVTAGTMEIITNSKEISAQLMKSFSNDDYANKLDNIDAQL